MPQPPMNTVSLDDFQTPDYGLRPLLPYIPNDGLIWECASGKGNLVLGLETIGYNVFGTDIIEDVNEFDFLDYEPNFDFDMILTNPPYSLKTQFMERCYEWDKPFALLLPITHLATFKRQRMMKAGIQIIFIGGRINFDTPSGKGTGSWFETAWFTHGLDLPYDIMFPVQPIDRTPIYISEESQ